MPRLIQRASALLLFLVLASPAFAQDQAPPPLEEPRIGLFVLDVRGAMARFKKLPAIGTALGVDAKTNLPGRGLGIVVGAHVYPVRTRSFALGLGGEMLLRAKGSRTLPAETDTGPEGPTVTTRMTSFSPQVSLNFGKRDGYSYLSGGLGPATYAAELDDSPYPDDDPKVQAINYGGGARWFVKEHLAFSLDLRFYAIRPQEATEVRPALPRQTVMVFSAGISVR